MQELINLYNNPLRANRKGILYNAFPYPTKISPEAIAIYIACHTNVGDTVLDPFSGSGTTGLAVKLCDQPTDDMLETAEKMNIKPVWGKRNAILYEISSLGAFIGQVMCNPPSHEIFEREAKKLIKEMESELSGLYEAIDPNGEKGILRYTIWSEMLVCPSCKTEVSYWDNSVRHDPLEITQEFNCPKCDHKDIVNNVERSTEKIQDPILNKRVTRKKRVPVWYYGRTGKKTWNRKVSKSDRKAEIEKVEKFNVGQIPDHAMNWGILHRKGYHKGITHLHHFYSDKNLIVFSKLWNKTQSYPEDLRNALRLLLLSYNASHSTLMSRVVVKKNNKDFVITGAQSGVLYISNLPVEKNILEGVKRKIKTFTASFKLVENSKSKVDVVNASSTDLKIADHSVDYVFTDPPFGDYIPYSEINQINEAWLGMVTDAKKEAIINKAQDKGIEEYTGLMSEVFSEAHRTLKDTGSFSLVFHSAQAEIWRALVGAFQTAGFKVSLSSILDKVQGSFKQVTSSIKVQGDPLLLLNKANKAAKKRNGKAVIAEEEIIQSVLYKAFNGVDNDDERKPERLFSRYITTCLETGIPVSKNAKQFYKIVQTELQENSHI